ncbi:helix-turn-helix domain-containing protein [Paenibacillus lutimineralis]|uniref:Helix-turn-helix domain-containing protein n=1 Tax=Paenibacillus lutimineralis TaxID=2707005 RepID=A0A3Q9IB90_9BACL|nr:helix-turn-helix domain-containing protein [Paenibacillus lutimineralis]AZS15271.1 helix-turn-helix domain-containing protein [Paenibacillus lutimineralis]
MKIRSGNYYTRLLMYSLLIGSIPVIIVGIISYYKASSIVQDKVNQSSMATLQQTQLRVEQTLKTIDHSITQYISSPLVVNAMSLPYSAEHYQVYSEMYQNMVRSQTFELTINNMTVLNLKGQWGVDNNNIFTFDDVLNLDHLLGYEKLPSFSVWVTDEDKSSPSISLVKKIPLNSLKADGLAIVTIAESQLANLLAADNQLGSIMVMDQDYQLLSRSDQKIQQSGLEQLVAEMQRQSETEGQFNIELDGDNTSVIIRKSSYNGWTYVSAISIKDITRDSRSIGWVTLFVCLLMVLITGGLAWLGSRKFYRPVGKLVATMANRFGDPPDEARTDEFTMIGYRLQSLLQTESRLLAQLTGQVRELKQFFVMKLIRGEQKESQLSARLKEYGYPTDWNWHAALAIQIDALEKSQYSENDRDLLLFAIANIVGELIPPEERLDPVLLEQSQITVVGGAGSTEVEYKSRLFTVAELIQTTVLQYLKLHISIGISRPQKRLADISESAVQALEALRYKIRFGTESVLFIDDVQPNDLVSSVFPHRAAKELYDAVKLAERTRAEELLEHCIGLIFAEQADWRQYRMALVRLYTMLTELGQSETAAADTKQDSAVEFPPEQEKQLFDRLLDLKSQEEIRLWFSDTVIAPIICRLEQQSKSHAKKLSDQLTNMIHQNFDIELTLEACAKQLNYHPNHLGPLFSREKGISFSEYLQNYRLQMAKQWLIETDMKIGDIADRLTYTNPQNFIRFFRKMENMTPGQYRKLHGNSKI